ALPICTTYGLGTAMVVMAGSMASIATGPGNRHTYGPGPARPGVGFQNSATAVELGFYAARSYSLIRPARMGRRFIRSAVTSAMGWSGRGGRRSRLRWGRRPL